jgi:hypothetical protein
MQPGGFVQQSHVVNADVHKTRDQSVTLGTPGALVQPSNTQLFQGGGLLPFDRNHEENLNPQEVREGDAAKANGKKAKKNDKLNCRRCNLPVTRYRLVNVYGL